MNNFPGLHVIPSKLDVGYIFTYNSSTYYYSTNYMNGYEWLHGGCPSLGLVN